jgi:hypothetical protein
VLISLLAPLLSAPLALGAALQSGAQTRPIPNSGAPIELAARYRDAYILFPELDALLLARYAESKLGRETRLFMLKLRVVDSIGREFGLLADSGEIQTMLDSIERDLRQNGVARDLDDYLDQQSVTREQFLESLRLAILQTKLSRRALGIPPDQPVSAEQQEMWLEAQIAERGLEEFPAPWEDGLVLRNGDVTLRREEFITFLRGRVERDELRNCLYDLVRVKRMKARMPDLDPEVLERAIDSEIENRRIEVQSDPKYQGISYEQLLTSQGILYSRWREDPNIVQAALARLWVQRTYSEEALREIYESERAFFDAQFGEALEARVLFLRATDLPNELIPRSYDAAEAELVELARGIRARADFEARVELKSEDRNSKKRKGYLGWVTRTGTSGPSPARSALFAALDSGEYKPSDPENSLTRLVGPVRTEAGVLLLWVGQRRPTPAWSTMVVHVHKVLRQRFVDEAMVPEQVITYLDSE